MVSSCDTLTTVLSTGEWKKRTTRKWSWNTDEAIKTIPKILNICFFFCFHLSSSFFLLAVNSFYLQISCHPSTQPHLISDTLTTTFFFCPASEVYGYLSLLQSPTAEPTWSICGLNFRHRASCILGQGFRYSPENAFYILVFNQHIYFIIWYLLDRASLI